MLALQGLMFAYFLTSLRQNAHGSEIFNGKKVPKNMMLYMASVQDKDHQHLCGGFLISEDFVLTAAHCDDFNPTSVVLGTHNLRKVDNSKMRYAVTRCKHPDYKNIISGNDIMLLKLKKSARPDNRVKTVKLPKTGMNLKAGATCQVAGWGLTKTGGDVVDELQMTTVSVVDQKQCKAIWKDNLSNKTICAGGYETKHGFCQGDSGGPLIYQEMAIGVVSFKSGENCHYPWGYPNVYTDVSKYLPWIKKILRKNKC